MKKIAIVTRRKNLSLNNTLNDNLKEVFENTLEIIYYFSDNLIEGDMIEADAILLMTPSLISEVKPYVKDIKKTIVVTRTLSEQAFYKVYNIPKNTRVLVVNDSLETTDETLRSLYQIGITHLNLIPFDKDCLDYEDIKIAITPNVTPLVPECIESVIDVGHRKLDTQTFLNLFNVLKVNDDAMQQNLIKYMQTLIEHIGVKKRYLSTFLLSETMEKVMHASSQGFLIVDTDFDIVFCNNKIKELLDADIKKGSSLSTYFDDVKYNILCSDQLDNELLEINKESVVINRMTLYSLGEIAGYYFNFNTARNINEVGTVLSNHLYRKGLSARYTFNNILYRSPQMKECIDNAKKVSTTDYSVTLNGETGTGKELFAQSIHNYSNRKDKPFVAVNCAALPKDLLESELFGYEGGSFTGSRKEGKIGLFEQANNGSIFLDEIGDMPLSLQSRLLRVLQEKQIMRIGSNKVIDINVRIITATNKDLRNEVCNGRFREDLFYRLNVFPIYLPPLRERPEDILLLFKKFMTISTEYLNDDINNYLNKYNWPGNVRELKNTADYFSLMKNVNNIIPNEINRKILCSTKLAYDDLLPADKSIIMEVMYIIFKFNSKNKGAGRQSLLNALSISSKNISENRLEKILHYLKGEEYIIRKRGRGGIRITDKGIKYINDSQE